MTSFDQMALPPSLSSTLTKIGFTTPTPIQAAAIPAALAGRDILGSAQTGTGKTAAFGVPLVAKLITQPESHALILTPTRELAAQVMTQLKAMIGPKQNIAAALLIGGDAMAKQLRQLKQKPRLIVGTPGRINDHLTCGSLTLGSTDFLVLDETDRMLDMGFTGQIEKIIPHLAKPRQTLLFSATLPKNITKIAAKYLTNPETVAVAPDAAVAANIDVVTKQVSVAAKYDTLIAALSEKSGTIIVFVKTKYGTEKMARKLTKEGFSATAIHGDLRQNKRDRVIAAFRGQKYQILVATDVAARGLDIPHIEHVINYDLPQSPEDYVHRIGRTARAGAAGHALNLIAPADHKQWDAIEKLLNPGKVTAKTKKKPAKKQQTAGHKRPAPSKKRPSPQKKSGTAVKSAANKRGKATKPRHKARRAAS